MSAERLIGIEKFCPIGMQIKSPGGVMFDRDEITGMEAKGDPEAYLVIHLRSGPIKITFHRQRRWRAA